MQNLNRMSAGQASYLQIEFKTPYVVQRTRGAGRKRRARDMEDETRIQDQGKEDREEGGSLRKKSKRARENKEGLVCTHCGKTSSPEWRRGPLGKNTLCNACGLYYAKNIKRQEKCKDQYSNSLLQLDYILHPFDREVTSTDVLWIHSFSQYPTTPSASNLSNSHVGSSRFGS
eukprot:TRINITY_DN3778_c0_g1_i1.p1 TRINITY_DN3778_c0_g1~~TRINITY_DN3778_c0_g1_i1.p1  ORF type:complete len:173 (-),score=20.49 TRINITY_DN3778_c0_g1_i1:115-633(-)